MKLLVSVVDESEVGAAVRGGADIIDVKNPREGSLGASLPHVIRRVRELTPPDLPVSAAIGDAPDLPGTTALAAAGAAGCGVQYVKVGLPGPRERAAALLLLSEVCRAVRDRNPLAQVVVTGYADDRHSGSLLPDELPELAVQAGAHGCMLDTANKGDGTLLSALPDSVLQAFVAGCRGAGLLCALAGCLREQDMPRILALAPDIVGVRGAACGGDRLHGRVDEEAVLRLKGRLASG